MERIEVDLAQRCDRPAANASFNAITSSWSSVIPPDDVSLRACAIDPSDIPRKWDQPVARHCGFRCDAHRGRAAVTAG